MSIAWSTRAKRASGFTLIEVLVAILVLSVGLLGLAALQATGLRNNHSATLRTIATLQAYDLADRMRANRTGLANYNVAFGVIPAALDCEAVSCTPGQMALFDLSRWNTANDNLLPAGTGEVRNAAGIFTISLRWTDSAGATAANPGGVQVTFATSLQP